jgi:hypothetical protein
VALVEGGDVQRCHAVSIGGLEVGTGRVQRLYLGHTALAARTRRIVQRRRVARVTHVHRRTKVEEQLQVLRSACDGRRTRQWRRVEVGQRVRFHAERRR